MGMGIGMMVGIIGTKAAAVTKETYDASSGRKMYEIMAGRAMCLRNAEREILLFI
jgi:hypothetical protein